MDFFSRKNILITGANGYIGSSLTNKLKQSDCKLFLLSRKGGKSMKNITWYKGDITEKGIWKKILQDIDLVFHFAAQTSSAIANSNPAKDAIHNFLPITEFIETCKNYGFRPDFIFSGTVTQVGLTKSIPVNEKFRDNPVTIYDIHKLAAEKYLQYYSSEFNGRTTILRLPNIYGPGQASSRADRGIVNLMIKKALLGDSLTVFGSGKYIRDYLYIDDVVSAFLTAAKKIKKINGNYYILGTGKGHSILQMVNLIKKEVEKRINKKIKIVFREFLPGTSRIELRNFIADPSSFKRDSGWKSAIMLQEGIKKTVEYFANLK